MQSEKHSTIFKSGKVVKVKERLRDYLDEIEKHET